MSRISYRTVIAAMVRKGNPLDLQIKRLAKELHRRNHSRTHSFYEWTEEKPVPSPTDKALGLSHLLWELKQSCQGTLGWISAIAEASKLAELQIARYQQCQRRTTEGRMWIFTWRRLPRE